MGRQSELIKKLRADLTQEEFAEKVGDHRQSINRYETEKIKIPLEKFLNWCEIMEVEFSISLKK
jgi:transcriptional regulator with XRE-family HTH domain